jgi:PPOX class probable F420-dependent enzyme
MGIALSEDVTRLLDGRNFAHLATLASDGSPHCSAVWVGREGDRVLICTVEKARKAKSTLRDPRVAISIVDFDDPYRLAQLRGRVVEGVVTPSSETSTRFPRSTWVRRGHTVKRRCSRS